MGLLILFSTFRYRWLVRIRLQSFQSLDFSVSIVDVVAPLLTLGYLVGIFRLGGLTFRNFGGDVVG